MLMIEIHNNVQYVSDITPELIIHNNYTFVSDVRPDVVTNQQILVVPIGLKAETAINLENGEGEFSIKSSSTYNYDGSLYDTDEKIIEATGHESFAFGRGCKATGTRSYSYGSYGLSQANCSYVIGQNNIATEKANRGFVGGYGNKIDNNTTFAFGQGLINSHERKATFGKWNYDEWDTLLEVGCGTSDADRRNAFEVRTNGLGLFHSRLKVYGKPEDSTDVVRLEELDEKVKKINSANKLYGTNEKGEQVAYGISSSAGKNCVVFYNEDNYFKVMNAVENSHPVTLRQLKEKQDKIDKIIFEERTDSEQTTRIMNGRVRSYSAPSAVDSYWAGIEPMGLTIHYVKSEAQSEDGGAIYHWHLKYPEENEWSGDTDIVNTPPKTSGTLATLTDIANEIAKVVGGADTSYDTLKEIADWIKAHPNDVAALVTRISALESGKLDKVTSTYDYSRLYGITTKGEQSIFNISGTGVLAGGIVARLSASGEGGQIKVPETPTKDYHATSRKFVLDCTPPILFRGDL